jgi:hypothetical protein
MFHGAVLQRRNHSKIILPGALAAPRQIAWSGIISSPDRLGQHYPCVD